MALDLLSSTKVRKEFIRCRTIGHSWDQIPHTPGEAVIRLRCVSCTGERYDDVDPFTGERTRNPRYRPAPGYRQSRDYDEEVPTKSDWRLRFLIVGGIITSTGKVK